MKDRNTIIFYFIVSLLSLVIALTAPLTVPFFKLLLIIISICFFLFGTYSTIVISSKRKSAFTISRMEKSNEVKTISPTIPRPHLKEVYTENSFKRQ